MNAVFCAKRERRGEEKNKAAVTSPLFWLFRPPTHTSIDWRRRCQKDQSKHDTLLENCHLSGYQKYRQQHKPQEITTTRAWITFNNVRLSGAKVRFAQSKFSLCLSQRWERKGGKPVVQKNSKVMFHECRESYWTLEHTCKVIPQPWDKWWGEADGPPPPQGFWSVAVFRKDFPSVEILWFSPQNLVYFMGGGAAGDLWRHQTWSPSPPLSWILSRIRDQVRTVRINNFFELK